MSDKSGIQWTDATWNPVSGCTRVSAGCDHCYAVKQTHRLGAMGQEKYKGLTVLNPRGDRHFNGVVRCHEDALAIPLGWRKPRRIFVNSMSDLFHKDVPFAFVDRVMAVAALTPRHTYQVLTKRPARMAKYFENLTSVRLGCAARELVGRTACSVWQAGETELAVDRFDDNGGIIPNVWLGTSVEDQAAADERIPHLLRCPAAVRFLSCEPLLGPIDLAGCMIGGQETAGTDGAYAAPAHAGIGWVIVGGESGSDRVCDVGWLRSIVGQCGAACVPVFVKQLGSRPFGAMNLASEKAWGGPVINCDWKMKVKHPKGGDMAEWPVDLRVREMPGVPS